MIKRLLIVIGVIAGAVLYVFLSWLISSAFVGPEWQLAYAVLIGALLLPAAFGAICLLVCGIASLVDWIVYEDPNYHLDGHHRTSEKGDVLYETAMKQLDKEYPGSES